MSDNCGWVRSSPDPAASPGQNALLPFDDLYGYRRLGASYCPAATEFRVWAPLRRSVELILLAPGEAQCSEARSAGERESAADGQAEGRVDGQASGQVIGQIDPRLAAVEPRLAASATTASATTDSATTDSATTDSATTRWALERESASGYWSLTVPEVAAGTCYWYLLDGQLRRPDPASRFQPLGVHGPSQVVDQRFEWSDQHWAGIDPRRLVIYELHVGAFSKAGTYRGVEERLAELVQLGVTAIELMPLAQSPGRWNWGYDGVNLFAPRNSYGSSAELKRLVDACHRVGLAVILDVVYNHLGPEGNYLRDFGPYFSDRHHTPWGQAFNLDGDQSRPVRNLLIRNALYWLEEFHLDGLRLDAVHFIHDDSPTHLLDELGTAVGRLQQTQRRRLHLIAESNIYDRGLLEERSDRPAYGAIWSDCLMHALYSLAAPDLRLTHRHYAGPADLAEAVEYGYLYELDQRQADPRRVPSTQRAATNPRDRERLICGLQTHDGVGNHPGGRRLHQLACRDFQRAALPLVLLAPGIPLLFMGEESSSNCPFPFFVEFEDPQLQVAIAQGRALEYPQHPSHAILDPTDPASYWGANLDSDPQPDVAMRQWYQSLLAWRHRAVEQGWLCGAHYVSHCDSDRRLFGFSYRVDGRYRMSVWCFLAGSGARSFGAGEISEETRGSGTGASVELMIPADPSVPGESAAELLMLASHPTRQVGRRLSLRPNQAVVWMLPPGE